MVKFIRTLCTLVHTVPVSLFWFLWLDRLLLCFEGQEREVQKNYWIQHSADLTVEAMMLDSQASDLDKEERPEVMLLSACPSLALASFFSVWIDYLVRWPDVVILSGLRSVFSVFTTKILTVPTIYIVEQNVPS